MLERNLEFMKNTCVNNNINLFCVSIDNRAIKLLGYLHNDNLHFYEICDK